MKSTWFAAILTSSFSNLNNGHISCKCWTGLLALSVAKSKRSIIFALLKVSSKGFDVCCCCCLLPEHAAWNKFTVASFRGVSVKPGTGPEHLGTLPD